MLQTHGHIAIAILVMETHSDTNMYLERSVKDETRTSFTVMLSTIILYFSFHNKLKTTYLNGKVNKRIDRGGSRGGVGGLQPPLLILISVFFKY